MTETTASYTIDPPVPADIESRLGSLEGLCKALIAKQQTQGELLEVVRDEQMLHVKGLDDYGQRIVRLESCALTALSSTPRFHMRVQVTKNTKGYSFETSISVDDDDAETVCLNVRQLLIDADTIARQEIERRELLDGMMQS